MAKNKATIEITAKDKTKGAFRSVNKGLRSVTSSVFSTTSAIAGLVGAAGFGALIKSSLETGDALAKTADKLGITTEALAGLQHAAELSGVSSKTLDTSLQRLQRRLSEVANTGGGAAATSLETLGLSAKALLEIPIEDQMLAISDAMQGLPEQSDKVRAAFGLFDTEGVNLVNTLQNGSVALREATSEAASYGVALSRVDAAQMEAVNDSFLRVSQVVKGLGNQLTVQLAPFITAVADEFTAAATSGVDMGATIIDSVEGVALAFGIMGNGVRGITVIFAGLQAGAALAINGILESILKLANGINSIKSYFGFDTTSFDVLKGAVDASSLAADEFALKFQTLALDTLPSEIIAEKFTAIREAAAANAQAIAEQTETKNVDELSAAQKHNQNLVALENSKTRQMVSNRKKELDQLAKFNALSWQGQTQQVSGELLKMTAGVSQSSKTLFRINKVAGIANAVINTSRGVTNALAAYPPPLSFAMAGAQLAAGIAQVRSIKSTTFGGGSSVPSVGGGGGGISSSAPAFDAPPIPETNDEIAPGQTTGSTKTVNINLQGQTRYSKDEVRDLIDQINIEVGDGAQLVAG